MEVVSGGNREFLYLRNWLWVTEMKKAFGNGLKEHIMLVMESRGGEEGKTRCECRKKTSSQSST